MSAQPMPSQAMNTQTTFQNLERELMNMQLDSMMEHKVLQFWREHEPKKIEELLSKQMLKKAVKQMSNALWDLQMSLEKTEKLNPVLAESEAWNRLMRIEEDAEEEAAAFGMTLEEYQNRP